MTNTNEVYLQNAVDTAVMNTTVARATYFKLKNMSLFVGAEWVAKFELAGEELVRLTELENLAKDALFLFNC